MQRWLIIIAVVLFLAVPVGLKLFGFSDRYHLGQIGTITLRGGEYIIVVGEEKMDWGSYELAGDRLRLTSSQPVAASGHLDIDELVIERHVWGMRARSSDGDDVMLTRDWTCIWGYLLP